MSLKKKYKTVNFTCGHPKKVKVNLIYEIRDNKLIKCYLFIMK